MTFHTIAGYVTYVGKHEKSDENNLNYDANGETSKGHEKRMTYAQAVTRKKVSSKEVRKISDGETKNARKEQRTSFNNLIKL
jgi:hypothetical protein